MVRPVYVGIFFLLFISNIILAAELTGGIRGMIYDSDFEAPLAAAQVTISETGEKTVSTDAGNYVFGEVKPGTYTVIFSKDGYVRQVKANVVVSEGKMTEVDSSLAGDFTEMEEFVVQDLQVGAGSEAALLDLRMESPAMMDSVGSELMSQAGAGDAAAALRLVAGTTVQDGKYAVVRGLPDRYVNSQLNGIRLPTADTDKRAVQLDQFPSASIESIQVSKTFTPDQQGDASGGAVNVILKGIPEETTINFSTSTSWSSPSGGDDFLSHQGKGLNYWGRDNRDIPYDQIGENWGEPVGISTTDAPTDYKWAVSGGTKYIFENGAKLGGLGSFFYEKESSYYEDGIDDSYWVESPGAKMTPQYSQGAPSIGEFKSSLFDVTQGSEQVQWGGLGLLGLELEDNKFSLLYMYTQMTEDTVTLSENTRGKASLNTYWPDLYGSEYNNYNPDDPTHPGNTTGKSASPYIRTETLEYTERKTKTLQFSAEHKLPDPEIQFGNWFWTSNPELSWSVANSVASLYQPDKTQFGSLWYAPSFDPGFPPWLPPSTSDPLHLPYKPAANFTLGNVQHIWKDIEEESNQYKIDLKLPFEQWSGDEGYLKTGLFHDKVDRSYDQDSFSNFNDNTAQYIGSWEDLWSRYFPYEDHPITAAEIDVDYEGKQKISAYYWMADVPLNSYFNIMGGVRYEKTDLSIINMPENDVTWIPDPSAGQVQLNPGDADVTFKQDDTLPSIGFTFDPWDTVTLRGSYSETVARQTFKELTPIQQQEYLGGDVFIGNPDLQMSSLENYDLRLDYTPVEGSLVSASYFHKDVKDPIEYVQRNAGFTYTTPMNYPEGVIDGIELEARQELARFWDKLDGISVGANATFIDSEVTLPQEEAEILDNLQVSEPKRDMTNTPEYLYNLFTTYDIKETGTQLALFYTVRGDTLVAGAGQSNGKYIPNVYELEYGTLNFSLTQKLGEIWKLRFQAKNLLDPAIETVYRSDYIGDDVTKGSYRKGMEFSIGLSATF
jgi:TonB-dependent receptor